MYNHAFLLVVLVIFLIKTILDDGLQMGAKLELRDIQL